MRRVNLASVVLVAAIAVASVARGAPGLPVAGGDGDRRAFDTYRARLEAIMAAERPQAMEPSHPSAATVSAASSGRGTIADCGLFQSGGAFAPAAQCRRCHAATSGVSSTHPVDIDYEPVQTAPRGSSLRASTEVVRRGVFLPGGTIRCGTCHDPRSPWKHHLALPPGATPTRAVHPGVPATYDDPPATGSSAALRAPRSRLTATVTVAPPGAEVSPKPLCLSCHAMD